MLVKPPMELLMTKADNRYTLAILVAKRARQLVDGAQPMSESESPNLVTVACEEIAHNAVRMVHGHVTPVIPLRPEIEAARLAARNAALNASSAEAIREELDQIAGGASEDFDESDVRIIADNLVKEIDSANADTAEAGDRETADAELEG